AVQREVRMGIDGGGSAMGGPTGVGDAGEATEPVLGNLRLQFSHACGAAGTEQFAVVRQRHAAGVIAPIFQPLQALEQDWGDVPLRNRANNTAHDFCLLSMRKSYSLRISVK